MAKSLLIQCNDESDELTKLAALERLKELKPEVLTRLADLSNNPKAIKFFQTGFAYEGLKLMLKKNLENMSKVKDLAQKAGKTAKKTATKTVNAAKANPIGALKVVGAIAGIYLLYKVVKTASDKITSIGSGDTNIDDQIEGTGGSTVNATITEQQAINFASQLLTAMNAKQPLWGTDEETIFLVFDQLTNGDDFNLIYKAFGKKDYNGHNSPPTGPWSYLDSYDKRDLVYWLNSEIDPNDDPELHQKVKEIIDSTGVFVF